MSLQTASQHEMIDLPCAAKAMFPRLVFPQASSCNKEWLNHDLSVSQSGFPKVNEKLAKCGAETLNCWIPLLRWKISVAADKGILQETTSSTGSHTWSSVLVIQLLSNQQRASWEIKTKQWVSSRQLYSSLSLSYSLKTIQSVRIWTKPAETVRRTWKDPKHSEVAIM